MSGHEQPESEWAMVCAYYTSGCRDEYVRGMEETVDSQCHSVIEN
jgi:hypothetical protein